MKQHRFVDILARPTEIQRNRNKLGPVGRNLASRGSVGELCRFFKKSRKISASRRYAIRPVPRRKGETNGNSRSIGRNSAISPTTWAIGRNCAHRGSVADCVGSAENPEISPRARRPAGSVALGRDSGIPPPEMPRFSEIGATGRNFAPRRLAADCVETSENLTTHRPAGSAEQVRESGSSARPAAIHRRRNLRGEIGREFVPLGLSSEYHGNLVGAQRHYPADSS